jgi:hypothetical protein
VRHPVIESVLDGHSRRYILLGGGAAAAALAGLVSGLGRPVAVLALSLLLVGLASGMDVLSRGRRVPGLLRERFSAARDASPRHSLAGPRPEALREARGAPTEPAPSGADRLKRPEAAGRPVKPPKPKARPAKPAGAAKPRRAPKPGGAAKPLEAAKPPGAAKVSKPAQSAKPTPPSRTKPGAKPQTRRRKRSPTPRTNLRPVGEQSRPVATDAPHQEKLTCSIFGWRDGRVADFYAVAFGLQGREWIVERSPRFFWPAGDIPHEAYEAHAILVDALLRAGWRAAGNEGAWYRQRFERAIETAPE